VDIETFFGIMIRLYEEQENLKITYKVESINEGSRSDSNIK
jgi:hypothetical protein